MATRKETDLYGPVKQYLEAQGYTVRGEVAGADVMAVRDETILLVELKTAFNLTLLLQGVERQKATDLVYLAVERPKGYRGRHWGQIVGLCRRLGLGLITVSFSTQTPRVEVDCDPGPFVPHRQSKKRSALLKEFGQRSLDHNIGGSTRRPLVTAYREGALAVAHHLQHSGPSRTRDIKAATGRTNAAQILQADYYGWFERVEKGVYRLAPKGEQALTVYADVVAAGLQPGS